VGEPELDREGPARGHGALQPDEGLLRMRAEMRLPGQAWLEWRITPTGPASSVLRQRALFHPTGLLGRAYWYAMVPFHARIFSGMARAIAQG
jgi:hypothetical protein